MKKNLFFISLILLFSACSNNEEEENYSNTFTSIATVVNPDHNANFYFQLDNIDRMWIAGTNFPDYKPSDGQRIIANYSILSVNDESSLYNHTVYLNDVYEVLTKNIYNITEETQDSIGNDPIELLSMWIGSDYLNFEFRYPGYDRIHFINLVSDTTIKFDDGKVHLEFRHNANDDYPQFVKWGVVSFNLSTLKVEASGDSVNLVIHTNEYGYLNENTYALTYKFATQASFVPERTNIKIQKEIVAAQ